MLVCRFRRSLVSQVGGALMLLGTAACGGDGDACVIPPCPVPTAVQLTVRDSVSASPLSGASLTFSGPFTGGGPCDGATCVVFGGAGTYELDVSVPGYRSVHRQVVVASSTPVGCGCATVVTQQVVVVLTRIN